MNFQTRNLSQLKVYANNPRQNNDAVNKVKLSIRKYGYKVPIVIDDDDYIVAGHTRFAALLDLHDETGQYSSIQVVLADDLDQNEINQFRIVDNQVAAIATWDFMKLRTEIEGLEDFILDDFGDIDGFDATLDIEDAPAQVTDTSTVTIAIGNDKYQMSEADFHEWCSYIILNKQKSVIEFVKSALELERADRRYPSSNDDEI